MKALMRFSLTVAMMAIVFNLSAQDIVGKWKTIDDETHKPKSVVQIYKASNGKYYGKIIKLYREPGEDPNPKCDKCKGKNKNKPIIGMVIITDMKKVGRNEWNDGEILDPASGNVYDCKMWIEGGKLHVRGYLGWSLIGRSQVWLPYKGK